MDWGTHIVLAAKLLETCGCDKGAAIYSVLPVIDFEPVHYHRQYGHVLENQPILIDAAIEIFSSQEIRDRDFKALKEKMYPRIKGFKEKYSSMKNDPKATKIEKLMAKNKLYFYQRVTDTAEGLVANELDGAAEMLGKEVANITTDKLAAALSLISHTYFDIYNNPVSVFLPFAANYSACWELWNRIDYLDFKATFYDKENIIPFRKSIRDDLVWEAKIEPGEEEDPLIRSRFAEQDGNPLDPCGMIKAMIERLGEMAPGISPSAVDMGIRRFFKYLGRKEIVHSDREMRFCLMLEKRIEEAIEKRYAIE